MSTTGHIGGAVALSLALTSAVIGHGTLSSPPSRIYIGFNEGPESPESQAVADAIAIGGTQPLYDWNELVAFHPGTPEIAFQRFDRHHQ